MGSDFSVGGATLVSLLGNHLPIHLTVINYKIFGKVDWKFFPRGTRVPFYIVGDVVY